MARQKYSFKGRGPNSPRKRAKAARLKKIKQENKRSAAEQERISDNRSHKGQTLNAWTPEDMEAACKQ